MMMMSNACFGTRGDGVRAAKMSNARSNLVQPDDGADDMWWTGGARQIVLEQLAWMRRPTSASQVSG